MKPKLFRPALRICTLLVLLLTLAVPPVCADTTVASNITTDTTWTLAGSPYIITGYITVQGTDGADGITTLTIEPGAVVKFNQGRYLYIGGYSGSPGALIAQGTAANPIVFTSNQATPTAGYWSQIKFNTTSDDATSVLQYCTVEYAGSGNQGAVNINQASPTIGNTTIASSSSHGIYISTGSPVVDGCQFSANGNYDLYYSGTAGGSVANSTINNGIYLYTSGAVGFSGNTVNQNNSFPIKAYADNAGAIVNGCTFANVDSASYLEIVNGNITKDAVWTAAIPYLLSSYTTVQGIDGADGITTLTIAPGALVKFNQGRYLYIGAYSGSPGALIAQGTAANPIVFTSNQATPTAGYWSQIKFNTTSDDATSVLQYCTVEYAGSGNQGAVNINQASPTIGNTTIANSSSHGIYISTGSPAVDGCQFSANGNYDLNYSGTAGGSVANSTINNGIYLYTSGAVGFSGNTVNQNNSFPIKAYADNVGSIVNGCTFANVDSASYLEIVNGNITKDAVWTAAIPYLLSSYTTVQGIDGADGITTLTIAPGALVKFNQGRCLYIGAYSGSPGALIAQGTAANPIVFTSNQATPTAGYWGQIKIDNTSHDATTVLSHCVLEYGGSGNQGMLYLGNAKPAIAYCTFRHSSHAGLYVNGSGATDAPINCNTFAGNLYGLYVSSALPVIQQNNFNGNTNYGLYFSGAGSLIAEDNWWGDAAGPNQAGDKTYGNVDADPWSAQENDCTGPTVNQPPNVPSNPTPADAAVRVSAGSGVSMNWTGGDPNPTDTVTYDLYWGLAADALQPEASALTQNTYLKSPVNQGATYYWQVVAKDDQGGETPGPVWHFTTDGDPPDLIVSALTVDPAGHVQSGQTLTFTATVQNVGSGPAVDAFTLDFLIDGTSIGTVAVNTVIPAGGTVQAGWQWTYNGGDPGIDIIADHQSQVSETNEGNNHYIALLSEVADNAAPALIGSSPAGGQHLQQIQQISISLADSQGTVDDAAVIASFSVTNSSQQSISGTLTESNDTFTFVPGSLPLADSVYQVAFTAADTYGNAQNHTLDFTIDTQPPAKPTITGGVVDSGTISPRPALNTSGQFLVDLTGIREVGASVWINGIEAAPAGGSDWAAQLTLMPGTHTFEIWLRDLAGNQGASEWVDIQMQSSSAITYEYDGAGRVSRISE